MLPFKRSSVTDWKYLQKYFEQDDVRDKATVLLLVFSFFFGGRKREHPKAP
jgi:hypothetical protein